MEDTVLGKDTTGEPCSVKSIDASIVDEKVNSSDGTDERSEKTKRIDRTILKAKEQSEANYHTIVEKVLDISDSQLGNQNKNKTEIRGIFKKFFMVLLIAQFVFLCGILVCKGFVQKFYLSDTIIAAYIGSVFVETLSVVLVMVKFSFDTEQETHILDTLNSAVKNYQKFKND